MKLYDYYRSSASYRIRIALNYKEVGHEVTHVNLLKQEQRSEKYHGINPQGLVPSLHTEDATPAPIAGHVGVPGGTLPQARLIA